MKGIIETISVSKKRGEEKRETKTAVLVKNYGIKNDAHGGATKRQVSMLSLKDLKNLRAQGIKVKPGDMAENILVKEINTDNLQIGDKLIFNNQAVCEITQVGKKCHDKCSIGQKLGKCSMSDKGIFMKVVKGGQIKKSCPAEVKND